MLVPISVEMSKHSMRSGTDVEPERLLEAVQRLDALLAAALGAQLLLVDGEDRVALGQFQDAPLVPALGGADLDVAAAARAERLGQRPAGGPSSRWTTTSGGTDMALA